MKKNIALITLFLTTICFFTLTNIASSNDSISQQKVITQLSKKFSGAGWTNLSLKTSGTDTITIIQDNMRPDERLTEGSLLSIYGILLEPNTVSILQNSGFKKGIYIDGKSREYPFEISTKYYKEFMDNINSMIR